MPNFLGITKQKDVYGFLELGLANFALGNYCHEQMRYLLCLYAFPKCTLNETMPNTVQIHAPCEEFCEEVTRVCLDRTHNYLWLLRFKCQLLPSKVNTKCIHPQVHCNSPPQLNNSVGHWQFNSTKAGSKAFLRCPAEYFATGTEEIRCQYTGAWTVSEAQCILKDDKTVLYAGIGTSIGLIVVLILAIPAVYQRRYEINVLLYNRCRGFRFKKQAEDDQDKAYDAFVAFSVLVRRIFILQGQNFFELLLVSYL